MTWSNRYFWCTAACLILAGQSLMAHDPHDPMDTVALSPNFAQDQTIMVATGYLSVKATYFLMKSTDGGVNWSIVPGLPNNSQIFTIAFSPGYSQDQTIYVSGSGGLFESTNGGTTWSSLSKQSIQTVTLSPNFATDNTLFLVTTKRTISKSTDRGQTWTSVAVPPGLTAGLNAIAVSPNYALDHTLLLGGNADGIFESTNGGGTWTQVTSGLTLPKVTALTFSPDFASDRTAYAGTFGSGFLASTTGGSSWTLSNLGISDLNVTSLALSPTYLQDSTLWITTAVNGVFESTTFGASWTRSTNVNRTLSNLTTTHYQTVVTTSTTSGPVLYLGMYEGLWTSSDTASSWLYIDTLPTRLIRGIYLSPNFTQDGTVFAPTYGGGNLWSTDGGSTWNSRNTGMDSGYTAAAGISPNYAVDGTAFSGGASGLQRSNDRGATWQLMPGLGISEFPRGFAISPNFAQDTTVFIGTDKAGSTAGAESCSVLPPPDPDHPETTSPYTGLFRSPDAGYTWLNTSLSGVTAVVSISVSPAFASDRTAFAASPQTGLYKSTDGGNNWTLIPIPASASQQMEIVAVTSTFATDQTLFVVGLNGGIFKSSDSGATWSALPQTNNLRALDLKISPNYASDQSIFAGTQQRGLIKFTQGGTKIVPITAFPETSSLAVGISPNFASDHTIFAAGYHGLYKTKNGGQTWTYLSTPGRMEDTRQAHSTVAPQDPPSISYHGSWTSVNPASLASTNAYMVTSSSSDTATLNFTGSGVRWVSWTGPSQGSATIKLDGVSKGSVSLNGPVDQYQQSVWERHNLTCGLHTLTITAYPNQGQTVSLDAFDVWVDTCP
jgi:photosystem II stability/assembly factor-like uncharacterized protein